MICLGVEDFLKPISDRIIMLSRNNTLSCMRIEATSDGISEVAEEMVEFRLTNFGSTPVAITVPTLTLIIEPSPPVISVPTVVNASEGNAAVVCLMALLPPNGEAAIGLIPFNVNTSESD